MTGTITEIMLFHPLSDKILLNCLEETLVTDSLYHDSSEG